MDSIRKQLFLFGGGVGVKAQRGGGEKGQNEEKEEASTREMGALIIYSTSVY